MRQLITISFYVILTWMLYSCQAKQHNKAEKDINTVGIQYMGMWRVVPRVIPYGALLTIDADHTFTYKGGACVLHFGSAGFWHTHGDTLVLNSKDTSACLYTKPFGLNCVPVDSPYIQGKTRSDCNPIFDGNEFVVFSDERFLLRNDTIFHVRRDENPCPMAQDNFFRIRKKED